MKKLLKKGDYFYDGMTNLCKVTEVKKQVHYDILEGPLRGTSYSSHWKRQIAYDKVPRKDVLKSLIGRGRWRTVSSKKGDKEES